ncbi:MAG: hypothetical protein A3J10_02220 [Candidatus Sungbacteria bacterium RIFCSPLOWO2_02_FULL_54_10]|uniref:Methyltransferase type 11 domain-containing protein n=2 Tax=Candidatus Sungiibacteriota TaxID=1817917 RepID=A0A1G2L8W9_9BACT|nr:MAG: hypothetical protein A3C92_03720 [Candidatus Sungbacteria bacterium RIFCSPHIGHO2_02_FULL_53_17]OHA08000.1 MAG: hypothetical protein A3B34_01030 [Candidatus Sungbacteria bacterium RIFCSPLOWO2_01_FULL_54_21]OHA14046.1 MAG: hypothetical protein A3J10_02220 [Candidatus Sungbacteria bacterium RIFCSPLOWO2_02_FULL_54_10]
MPSVYDIPFWSKDFYDHKARWIHYYHQVNFVAREVRRREKKLENFTVLEIGPSHGFVTDYLKKFGVAVTTLDNKKEYSPDVLGTVLTMPFPDDTFDMVLVCEVLEHLPFDDFPKALKEIFRICRGSVLLSEPDSRNILIGLRCKIPFFKTRDMLIKVQRGGTPIVKRGHYWEIGVTGFPLRRIRHAITQAGFTIAEEKTSLDTPRNYYFLLKKPGAYNGLCL